MHRSHYIVAALLLAILVPGSLLCFVLALTHDNVPFGLVYLSALVGIASFVTACVLFVVGPTENEPV